MEGRDPAIEGRDPEVEGRDPASEGRNPEVEGRDPAIEGRDPETEGGDPTIEGREASPQPATETRRPAPPATARTAPKPSHRCCRRHPEVRRTEGSSRRGISRYGEILRGLAAQDDRLRNTLFSRCYGVTDGFRTRDSWNHNPALYQLSYGHQKGAAEHSRRGPACKRKLETSPVLA